MHRFIGFSTPCTSAHTRPKTLVKTIYTCNNNIYTSYLHINEGFPTICKASANKHLAFLPSERCFYHAPKFSKSAHTASFYNLNIYLVIFTWLIYDLVLKRSCRSWDFLKVVFWALKYSNAVWVTTNEVNYEIWIIMMLLDMIKNEFIITLPYFAIFRVISNCAITNFSIISYIAF